MNEQTRNLILSWARVFVAAALTAWLTTLVDGQLGFDWRTVLIAGLVSTLPVIVNWLNPSDIRYGKGYVPVVDSGDGA